MIPAFQVYLFDVDGTLVDSAIDIVGAIQGVLSTTPKHDVPFDFIKSYIGRHLVDLFENLFPDYTSEQIDALVVEYRRIYPLRNHAATTAYPGVAAALSQLSGRKSTATTKGTPTTRVVLERFGLLQFFDHVQGTDGFPAKPNPDVIFSALLGLNASPAECLLVGDSPADIEAAHRAGVKSCAVTYGYGKYEELAKWEPTFWVDDLS
ncbi:MAG TPA: HAD family hydrolase, partial [Lacipirellulaceae bacterium]|nr:HAD family hydrolase [Lacipirellulaceae bacterium]